VAELGVDEKAREIPAASNQNANIPSPQTGACQRKGPGRHIPPMPKRIPARESKPPHRNILRSNGS
jgi:hypothetical protein